MLAFIVGALGVVANIFIYQQKGSKRLLLFKLVSDFLWALHYFLLNAYAAMAIALIGIFRESVFLNQDKKWAKSKWWLVLFLVCSVVSAIFTWKNIFSILPAIASVLSVISFWKNHPNLTRYLAFPISLCMLAYDVTCYSYAGIINEIFTLVSATIGMLRYRNTCHATD